MTRKERAYYRDYYRAKRNTVKGKKVYNSYMREYMRKYRAANPEYVAHEKAYMKTYCKRQKLLRLKEARS